MSTRTILVVFLALISGGGVAVGVLQSSRGTSTAAPTMETESVLVAIADIERTVNVTEAHVELREWPKGLAPPDSLRTVEAAKGRGAAVRILAGEIVREVKLAKEGMGSGVISIIPEGMRAVAVVASRVSTNVAGFVLPGSRVDVLLNLRGTGRADDTGGGSTTTLLQAVEVLAVDQIQDAPESNQFDPKALTSVTLLVTPDQANVLDLAQNAGTLSFALRNATDVADADVAPATLTDIRKLAMPPQLQNSSSTPILDGDSPPTPEILSMLTSQVRVEEKKPVFIATMRGSQRGRIMLTGADQRQ